MHHSVKFVLAAAALGFATSASAQTKWDMPVPYGDTNFHTQNIVQFAEDVKSATDGGLEITVHSNGSLFKHPDIKNAVRQGLAQIGEILGSRLSNEDPIYEVDSIPFLATSYDDAKKLYDASKDQLAAKLQEQGLQLLFSVPWPPQGIYTQKEISSVDDLKGLKMRAYNAATERLAQLAGSLPTQVEVPDLPTAFATGRVEAMITSPSTGANSKVWDFLSHYSDAQAWLPRNMVFVNKAAFDALPEDQQAAVLEAAATAETRGWEASVKETMEKTQVLKDNGITVTAPSAELKEGLAAIGAEMSAEWAEKAGDEGKAILEAYQN
ncbi:TRAP transporter substrate-binding protein [Nitratireductor rhodophyticola]|uniref:TRAP transporter substrate-binding protein n=1 Tax=Nitratireductor rhodophyticola TaxID=2854036 RepID=A0ABS7R559_9HYPH|nr:TRAP transporter substrate-binding protein [Nitratireductor rhodophyticola]MBY8915789.1 TRAP transporter substrate-binding protein [Nitratireductor rhodophyticola]MBY8919142.1 TRAP transporter substrate-binding protein [Nitratireductor rhodophyticola]MEC9245569.1 TRAP transporter substrate-binding protein [Pseudomonadota bacterium]WPZ13027.1 TRAP transporter substrate-binding protein [Nitratireductor rhodophyticola]